MSATYLCGRGISGITGEPADTGMLVDSVRRALLDRLQRSYGTLYTEQNTMVTTTHTRGEPGGYSHHRLYHSNTGGFQPLESGLRQQPGRGPAVLTGRRRCSDDAAAGDLTPNLDLRPGRGPTSDEVENTRIIGLRQYEAAARLMTLPGTVPAGGIDCRLTHVDLSGCVVRPEFTGDGREHRTGPPVGGASALAARKAARLACGSRSSTSSAVVADWSASSRTACPFGTLARSAPRSSATNLKLEKGAVMTTLRQEIDRWEAELDNIAETSQADNWFLQERRLAEAQHTLAAFRGHILPLLTARQPYDVIVGDEIEHLLDGLEDLRNDLFRTVHPNDSHRKVAETVAALRALGRVALRFEQTYADAS
jgi:hypothetical protein